MWRLLGLALWAMATCVQGVNIQGISLSGVLENKMQVDNRLTRDPRVRWELWGDVDVLSTRGKWSAHFTWANQVSSLENNSGSRLYQAYWEKNLSDWGSNLRLGRFQRTDLSGFYVLDGGQWNTQWNQWELQAYGGQAKRFDQLFTANIDAIYGVDVAYSGTPNYHLGPVTWRNYRVQVGSQQVHHNDNSSYRMQAVLSSQGSLDETRFWEMNLSGNYNISRSQFENAWFHGFADLTRTVRLRSNFEHYQPRNPLPSFRERFVYAYATGGQSLWRMEAQHALRQNLNYFIGWQRSTREDNHDGLGARSGFEYRTGSGRISATYDWLKFGQDSAHSGYLHASHALNSRLEVWINGALRHEDKRLYGINWSYGGESGFRHHISSAWAINGSFSYIANSERKSDYIGAFRVIYYLDHFRPKENKCLFDWC
ncbi:MAG: hypothetical protein IT524_08445 [Nitrosomonas sp.]|nr:hypothetical protein [Nitrosomonas sp.]